MSKVTSVAVTIVHSHVAISAVTIIMCNCGLSVMRSWNWCMAMHWRCRMVHSGLRHVTSRVEARVTMAVAAPVGNEHLWVCVEETGSVIVGVHCECPATCLPCYRTIEVS